MSTQLVNPEGKLLWDPKDFGQYSEDKIRLITSILKELLSSVTLNMAPVAPSENPDGSGFYTKDESDNRFLIATTAQSLIEELVKKYTDSYISSGTVTPAQYSEVRNWLIKLYQDVNGVNLDSPAEPSGSYMALELSNLSNREQSNANNIARILSDIYVSNKDGSISFVVKFPSADDIGITKENNIITSLSVDFTDRSTIVAAMNELMSKVKSLDLTTIQKDLTDLKSGQGDINTLDEMYAGETSTVGILNQIADSIRTIQSRLDALETLTETPTNP